MGGIVSYASSVNNEVSSSAKPPFLGDMSPQLASHSIPAAWTKRTSVITPHQQLISRCHNTMNRMLNRFRFQSGSIPCRKSYELIVLGHLLPHDQKNGKAETSMQLVRARLNQTVRQVYSKYIQGFLLSFINNLLTLNYRRVESMSDLQPPKCRWSFQSPRVTAHRMLERAPRSQWVEWMLCETSRESKIAKGAVKGWCLLPFSHHKMSWQDGVLSSCKTWRDSWFLPKTLRRNLCANQENRSLQNLSSTETLFSVCSRTMLS